MALHRRKVVLVLSCRMHGTEAARLLSLSESDTFVIRRSDQRLGGADLLLPGSARMRITIHDLTPENVVEERRHAAKTYAASSQLSSTIQHNDRGMAIFVCRNPEARAAAVDLQCSVLPIGVSALIVGSAEEAVRAIIGIATSTLRALSAILTRY